MAKNSKKATEPTQESTSEADAGVQKILIQGLSFTTLAPFQEGHSCSAVEAHVLNQTLAENLRNNFAKVVKTANDKAKAEGRDLSDEEKISLQESFNTYASEYTFNGKRSTRAPADPVLREATKLAKESLKAALKERNIEVSKEKLEALVAEMVETRPQFKAEATRRVNAMKETAAMSLEGLGV